MANEKIKIPYGYCHCGCGEKTKIAWRTSTLDKWIRGEPLKYINNHHSKGSLHYKWNGGRTFRSDGYIFNNKYSIMEHMMISERVLGKKLPHKAVIHHVDENRSNNKNNNLVICENRGYHLLLHKRLRALKSCGHADWLKCGYCGKYDAPINLKIYKGANYFHQICNNQYRQLWRKYKAYESKTN